MVKKTIVKFYIPLTDTPFFEYAYDHPITSDDKSNLKNIMELFFIFYPDGHVESNIYRDNNDKLVLKHIERKSLF